MTLTNGNELANTRSKLRALEERYQARLREMPRDAHMHELTLQSLKRVINQLKADTALLEYLHGCAHFQCVGSDA